MSDKDRKPVNDGDEVRPAAEGAEVQDTAAPEAQEEQVSEETADAGAEPTAEETAEFELTVDDILNADQLEEAAEQVKSDYETQLLHDLKRLQAEYANYRRRTEDQRHVEVARAKGEAARGLLPVLDDLARAEKHGDLAEGTPFAAIAEKVRGVAERLGVIAFGEAGEAFDPQHHEAIFQQPTPGATETTVLEVVEVGYRLGDVELRPAKVVVAVPAE
ncbi:nucleotide exchange factor GrpE [Microbacterium sp. MEC084]|uniref:nucleotide exchange factor GrpE n=1 Tax=unclassified Microbacterium TaxID=2609290 RepID=UPI0006FB5BE6|nr:MULTISPECIES: nucleotide exchange factor GrpE [unclassified Microbacterium]KQZ11938.1 molecular chaperone GrpE [Microbacterium sp. Root53]MCD1267901.1 nucleotide exchange factor GrpE [Microbacterium sp. MEC084]